jgi:hypothetical protein
MHRTRSLRIKLVTHPIAPFPGFADDAPAAGILRGCRRIMGRAKEARS